MQTVTVPSFTNSHELREFFAGRAHELMQIQEALTRNRLVAITGPFGCGKTALALMAADRLKPQFPGGIAIRAADPQLDISNLVVAAFPITPRQPALLILDEYQQLVRRP